MAKRKTGAAGSKAKTASKRRMSVPGAGNGGIVPPPEHRFTFGNQAAVGHGRPRKLRDLQELIYETLAEDGGVLEGAKKTRAQLLIRTMLVKSPSDRIALLEYAFGKVPQPVSIEPSQALQAALEKLGLTLNDVRNDPLAISLFAAAGISLEVGPEPAEPDRGGEGNDRAAAAA